MLRGMGTSCTDAGVTLARAVSALALGAVLMGVLSSCADVIGLASVDRVACVLDCGPTVDASLGDATRNADARPDSRAMTHGDAAKHDTGPHGCTSDSDCPMAADPRCDLNTGACVPCLPDNDNCPSGQICKVFGTTFQCAAGCNSAADCSADGGVALACCDDACVDTSSNVANCGMCGQGCSTSNITAACGAGVCIGTCNAGYDDCDNDKLTNGCEVNVGGTDIMNCGGCGTTCSSANITPTCTAGVCDGPCAASYQDCNSNKQSDGCETDIDTSSANCGTCGKACAPGVTCSAGVCSGCLTGGVAPPPPCTAGTESDGSPWVVCTSSCSAAWLSSSRSAVNSYNALAICNGLGYAAVLGTYAGNCGDTCGTCVTGTSCTAPGTPSFTGLTMPAGDVIGDTVEWECLP
jgi:hypothetical protein